MHKEKEEIVEKKVFFVALCYEGEKVKKFYNF